jgi:antitoxin component YwqK of YwqJK toxin-antitoxin module
MSKSVKKYVKYHDDGSVWARGTTVGGVAQGHWEWFRKDGSKMRSGYFTNGKQSGKWTTYQKNGKVVKVTDFGEPQKMKRQVGG